jgi:hypothetical protein
LAAGPEGIIVELELVGEVERYEDSYRLCYVRRAPGSQASDEPSALEN